MGRTGAAPLPGGMLSGDCPRLSVLPGGAGAGPDGRPGAHHIIVVGVCSVGSAGAAVACTAAVAGATLAIGPATSYSGADTSRASGGDPIGWAGPGAVDWPSTGPMTGGWIGREHPPSPLITLATSAANMLRGRVCVMQRHPCDPHAYDLHMKS